MQIMAEIPCSEPGVTYVHAALFLFIITEEDIEYQLTHAQPLFLSVYL